MNWLKSAWSVGTTIPSLLTGGYGILIRLGIIAVIAGGLFGYGWYRGYKHEEAIFDTYQQKVVVDGKVAALEAKNTKDRQDQTTKDLINAWNEDVAGIDAYYAAQQLRSRPGGGVVPASPVSAPSVAAAAGECRAPEPDRALEQRCALDAARVRRWTDFAVKNGFPVE